MQISYVATYINTSKYDACLNTRAHKHLHIFISHIIHPYAVSVQKYFPAPSVPTLARRSIKGKDKRVRGKFQPAFRGRQITQKLLKPPDLSSREDHPIPSRRPPLPSPNGSSSESRTIVLAFLLRHFAIRDGKDAFGGRGWDGVGKEGGGGKSPWMREGMASAF